MDTEFLPPTVPVLQGPRERIFRTNRFKFPIDLNLRGIEESEIRSLGPWRIGTVGRKNFQKNLFLKNFINEPLN